MKIDLFNHFFPKQFFQKYIDTGGIRDIGKRVRNMPTIVNLRQDPFERTPSLRGESQIDSAFGYGNEFFAREFWRFVQVQQLVAQLAMTAVEYPPMQDPASFNLDAVKKKIDEAIKNHAGQ